MALIWIRITVSMSFIFLEDIMGEAMPRPDLRYSGEDDLSEEKRIWLNDLDQELKGLETRRKEINCEIRDKRNELGTRPDIKGEVKELKQELSNTETKYWELKEKADKLRAELGLGKNEPIY